MPTVRVYINDEWVPFESLEEEQKIALRKKIGEIIARAIKQQIKELYSAGKTEDHKDTEPGCLSMEG